MSNGNAAIDVVVQEAETFITKIQQQPTFEVCGGHGDLCKGLALTLKLLIPLYKKNEPAQQEPSDNFIAQNPMFQLMKAAAYSSSPMLLFVGYVICKKEGWL